MTIAPHNSSMQHGEEDKFKDEVHDIRGEMHGVKFNSIGHLTHT